MNKSYITLKTPFGEFAVFEDEIIDSHLVPVYHRWVGTTRENSFSDKVIDEIRVCLKNIVSFIDSHSTQNTSRKC